MSPSCLSHQSIGSPAEEKAGRGIRVRRNERQQKNKGPQTTKQSSFGLTEIEAARAVNMGLPQVLCVFIVMFSLVF